MQARVAAAALYFLFTAHGAGEGRGAVHSLELDGVVTPVAERHLRRELRLAAEADAAAVTLRIDTPGGLVGSTRGIVEAILGSPVPVVVWVGPPGAHAASAGMFVTIAGHVAAMAPGTSIGAAHPVALGESGTSHSEPVTAKVVNDAAAFARAVAVRQGHNAEWAERAVRESVSVTAEEALALGVIDLVAEDRAALLEAVDGRRVETVSGAVVLATVDAPVVEIRMSGPERILQALANPNLAFLLLTLGMIGIIAELYNPGTWIAGITGAVALVLAFAALGNLPVNWAGVALLALAAVLLIADLVTEGFGVIGAIALAVFVLGSLLLYEPIGPDAPELPQMRVSPWLIALVAGSAAVFSFAVLRAVVRARHAALVSGPETLVGRRGIALSDLRPAGTVEVDRERWSAVSVEGPIPEGHEVRITGVEGVELRVRDEHEHEHEPEVHP